MLSASWLDYVCDFTLVFDPQGLLQGPSPFSNIVYIRIKISHGKYPEKSSRVPYSYRSLAAALTSILSYFFCKNPKEQENPLSYPIGLVLLITDQATPPGRESLQIHPVAQ